MNAVAHIAAVRPDRLQLVSFEAFKISPTGAGFTNTPEPRRWLAGQGTRLAADGLADAVNEALVTLPLLYKDMLAIRESTAEGAPLFLYAIKKRSQPRYVYRNHQTIRVNDLYADLVCMLPDQVLA